MRIVPTRPQTSIRITIGAFGTTTIGGGPVVGGSEVGGSLVGGSLVGGFVGGGSVGSVDGSTGGGVGRGGRVARRDRSVRSPAPACPWAGSTAGALVGSFGSLGPLGSPDDRRRSPGSTGPSALEPVAALRVVVPVVRASARPPTTAAATTAAAAPSTRGLDAAPERVPPLTRRSRSTHRPPAAPTPAAPANQSRPPLLAPTMPQRTTGNSHAASFLLTRSTATRAAEQSAQLSRWSATFCWARGLRSPRTY